MPVLMVGSVQPARHKIKSRTEVRAAASQHSSTAFTSLFLLYPFFLTFSRHSPPTRTGLTAPGGCRPELLDAYRAPEFFDVPSDATIDERTDVFSLSATLYAMGYYYSPFECLLAATSRRSSSALIYG